MVGDKIDFEPTQHCSGAGLGIDPEHLDVSGKRAAGDDVHKAD